MEATPPLTGRVRRHPSAACEEVQRESTVSGAGCVVGADPATIAAQAAPVSSPSQAARRSQRVERDVIRVAHWDRVEALASAARIRIGDDLAVTSLC